MQKLQKAEMAQNKRLLTEMDLLLPDQGNDEKELQRVTRLADVLGKHAMEIGGRLDPKWLRLL